MARKSVVVQAPQEPGRRRAVVVRPPTQRKDQRRFEWFWGVLGALLLVGAVALVPYLTQDPPPVPEFTVLFEEQEEVFATESHDFAAGETFEFTYDFAGQNLTAVAFNIAFRDDVASSDPDAFVLELVDPNGDVAIDETVLENLAGTPISGATPPQYNAVERTQPLSATPSERPPTTIVQGKSPGETVEDVADRIAGEHTTGGTGTWTIRVTLATVGGCPPPEGADGQRILACQAEGGEDTGNGFAVTDLKFIYYQAVVTASEE